MILDPKPAISKKPVIDLSQEWNDKAITLENEYKRQVRISKRKVQKYDLQQKQIDKYFLDLFDLLEKILRPMQSKKLSKEKLIAKLNEELKVSKKNYQDLVNHFVTKKKTKSENQNSLLQDMDNESMLFLSSNWSTGVMDYIPVLQQSFDNSEY